MDAQLASRSSTDGCPLDRPGQADHSVQCRQGLQMETEDGRQLKVGAPSPTAGRPARLAADARPDSSQRQLPVWLAF